MGIIKIERLIGIITILLQREKVTAPYLAERFEVSRRTINRDIEDICKAGIPIITIQGNGGGISIEEGYKINKNIFTSNELQTILAGLKGIDSIYEKSNINNIIDKFSTKNSVISDRGNILIDLSSHYKDSLAPKIESIKLAINEKKLISFRYFYNKGEADKVIEPYLLVFRWSDWYVFGYCLEREDFRLYKLNRLWGLVCTNESFEEREVPEEKLKFDRFLSDDIQLVALLNEEVKYRLIEEYGVDSFTYTDRGKLLFKRGFASKENLLSWVLSFGDTIEVIEPKEVCFEIRGQAESILKKYK